MNIFNVSKEFLTPGWVVGRYSEKIPPKISGLSACFIAKGVFKLHPRMQASPWEKVPPEPLTGDLPIGGDPSKGLGYASDFVPYKPVADFTAVGTAYPPKGDHKHFLVTMRVGKRSRTLGVVGDRFWNKGLILDTRGEIMTPARKTTISYDNAWGGLGYLRNPLGHGREGGALQHLVLPDRLVEHPSDEVEPAVLAPMPPEHPFRKSKTGTYDQEWVKTRWPWLPKDFDYSYYNAAYPSQWMEGYLRGDEELEFRNMHPEHPVYQSRLPGMRVRCFVERVTNWRGDLPEEDARTGFEEVPMDLDTLWVDMDEEKLVLVWRGRTALKSLKRRDLKGLLLITEPLDQPDQGLGHYHRIYMEEVAKRPKKPTTKDPLDPAAFCKEQGIPTSAEIKAEVTGKVEEAFADAAKKLEEGLAGGAAQLDEIEPFAPEHIATVRAELDKVLSDGNPITNQLANARSLPSSPAIPSFARMKEDLEKILPEMVSEAEKAFEIPLSDPLIPEDQKAPIRAKRTEFHESIAQLKAGNEETAKSFEKMEKTMAVHFPPRKQAEEFMRDGRLDLDGIRIRGLADADLNGIDFSGIDLSGVDFSRSNLNEALFVGSKLTGANFTQATMMETVLTDADLADAILDHVNLSSCLVSGTSWSGTSLNMADLSFLKLSGADFSKAKGDKTNFTGAELAGANFRESTFTLAMFTNALVENADFTKSSLRECSFLIARASGIILDDADLTKLGGGFGADFSGARFLRASATGSSWAGSDFTRADFQQADLRKALFIEAKLNEAHFDRCNLREASFDDALLQGAVLTNANLMEANFDRADLSGARLDSSNLYGSSFWDAILLGARWDGANVTKSSLVR